LKRKCQKKKQKKQVVTAEFKKNISHIYILVKELLEISKIR